MSDAPHLLIPLAASPAPGCQQTLKDLPLPHLDRLLARLSQVSKDSGEETDFSPPHERALARELQLPVSHGGITPWAAWQQQQKQGQVGVDSAGDNAWGYITPCQWHVTTDHITMLDPLELQLTPDSSRALMAIFAPWFAEDGIELSYDTPTRWIARGDAFEGLACASLDRIILRDVRAWMPHSQNPEHARLLHRLQSEMQMLLYTHPINDARAESDLPPVNTFWVHGAGRLGTPAPKQSTAPQMPTTQLEPAIRGDWRSWAEAWRALDAGPIAALDAQVAGGAKATLTLCGELNSLRFEAQERSFGQKIKSLFAKPQRFVDLQNQL